MSQTIRNTQIQENLAAVRSRIEEACHASGRDPKEVTLLAVSKTKPVEDIRMAMAAGQRSFGENYVQELTEKYTELKDETDFQMIGHLQRNKVKNVIGKVSLIHSVDSVPLAKEIEKQAAQQDKLVDILLEVNIAGEETKWGFTRDTAKGAAAQIKEMPHVRVLGLMTSAPITEDPESNRIHFRHLKELADEMANTDLLDTKKPVLSMGMTLDYAVAVEEGATIVRVGTAIFGNR